MKPPAFDYFAPTTLAEALTLLAEHGARASVLAGGQSLMPLLNRREVHPVAIIDINRLAELEHIHTEGETLAIGALTRHHQLETSSLVRQVCPLLAEAAAAIGSPAIRTRGTIGGNIAYADPAAELPLALVCLGASVVLASHTGRRELAIDDWLRGPFSTAITPDELLVEARIQAVPMGTGMAIEEISRGFNRPALVAAACLVALDTQGHVARAHLALCGAGASPRKLPDCEQALDGEAPTDDLLSHIAQQAPAGVMFASDVHASAALRRRMAETAMRRALTRAVARATPTLPHRGRIVR